jgi:hypothetical protein
MLDMQTMPSSELSCPGPRVSEKRPHTISHTSRLAFRNRTQVRGTRPLGGKTLSLGRGPIEQGKEHYR